MRQWTDDLITGVEEIDEQHISLFNIFDDLRKEVEQGGHTDILSNIFMFLEDYINTHFHTEEKYMLEYGYLEYEFHKSQHDRFISELETKKRVFLMSGESVKMELVVWLYFWFRKHILSVDKVLGEFIKKKNESGLSPSTPISIAEF